MFHRNYQVSVWWMRPYPQDCFRLIVMPTRLESNIVSYEVHTTLFLTYENAGYMKRSGSITLFIALVLLPITEAGPGLRPSTKV